MIENLNAEQLATTGGMIAVLLYIVKALWDKISVHEATIQQLNEESRKQYRETLDEINENTTVLQAALKMLKGD